MIKISASSDPTWLRARAEACLLQAQFCDDRAQNPLVRFTGQARFWERQARWWRQEQEDWNALADEIERTFSGD